MDYTGGQALDLQVVVNVLNDPNGFDHTRRGQCGKRGPYTTKQVVS
jgi:hypothetical protein